jgi:hypothetical protein
MVFRDEVDHVELYTETSTSKLAVNTVFATPPGQSVDFSRTSSVKYLGQQILDDRLNAGGLPSPSTFLYPAMPRTSYPASSTAYVDIGWDGKTSIDLVSSPAGTTAVKRVVQNDPLTIGTAARRPQQQALWYQVTSGGATGWIRAEYMSRTRR